MAHRIFDDIKAGLEEAVSIARGEADPSTYRVHVPSSVDVRSIRKDLCMTQQVFADTFGFTVTQVRDWEQGRVMPTHAVRAYLIVISREPETVRRALKAA